APVTAPKETKPATSKETKPPLIKKAISYDFEGESVYGTNPLVHTFNLSDPTQVSDFHLKLKFQSSPTLLKDKAFITVFFNDQVITSQKVNIDGETTIDLKIPANYAKSTNTLVVQGFLKSTDLVCELTDEINWMVAQEGSELTYTQESEPQIAQWFTQMQDENQAFHVAIPEEMTDLNYEQLANTIAIVAQAQQQVGQTPNIEVVSSKEMDKEKNYILIGTRTQIEEMSEKSMVNVDSRKELTESGGIAYTLIENQWQLALMTENETQLRMLLNTLEFSDIYKQIQTSNYVLQEVEPRANQGISQAAPLSELGYENTRVVGHGDQIVNFFIPTPLRQEVTAANFTFAYRSSEQIDLQQSFIEVMVNDTVMRTVPLVASEKVQFIDIALPKLIAEQGVWNVQLRFHLERLNPSCETSAQDDLWAEVMSDESLYEYESQTRSQYNFATSAGILQNDRGETYGEVAMNPEVITIQQFSNLMIELTKVSHGVDYLFVQTEISENFVDGIVIDSPQNEVMQTLTQETHFPVDAESKVTDQDKFIQISTILGQIQFQKEKPVMLLVSDSQEQTGEIIDDIKTQVIAQNAESVLFDGVEQVKIVQSQEPIEKLERESLDWQIVIPVIATVAILGIGATFLILRVYRKRAE
ncbi:MAG: cellulose biosynthesis cyclic di-GMP-binding regulatory protein BcsB, partial [Culicoidibacterales bacterium]